MKVNKKKELLCKLESHGIEEEEHPFQSHETEIGDQIQVSQSHKIEIGDQTQASPSQETEIRDQTQVSQSHKIEIADQTQALQSQEIEIADQRQASQKHKTETGDQTQALRSQETEIGDQRQALQKQKNEEKEESPSQVSIDAVWLSSMEEKSKKLPKLLHIKAGSTRCSIFRVPKNIMKLHSKSFQPAIVSIGPYYHGKKHLQMIEEHKWRIIRGNLNRLKGKLTLHDLFNAIAIKEKEIRECYSENIDKYNRHKLIEMMILDAGFIIELLCVAKGIIIPDYDDPIFKFPWMLSSLTRDLLMLENQIPLFVLEILYSKSIADHLPVPAFLLPSLQELILKLFNHSVSRYVDLNILCQRYKGYKGKHILDFYRSTFLPPSENDEKEKDINGGSTIRPGRHSSRDETKRDTVKVRSEKAKMNDGKVKTLFFVSKTDMEELLNTEMANVSLIHMYILFLNEEYKLEKFDIKFLCPHSISDNECQRRPNEVTKYINDVFFFEARKKKKLSKYILAPYLEDGHWILFVIDLSKGYLYMFDSLIRAEDLSPRRLTVASMMKSSYNVYKGSKGAKQCNKDLIIKPVQCAQQSGSTECGYYVMRYMFEIVTSHRECNIDLNEAYSIRKKPYIEELLEVREQCERFFIKNCMDGRESKESLSNKANVGGSSSLKEKNVDGSDSTQSLSKKDNVRENTKDEKDSTHASSQKDNIGGPSISKENVMDEIDSTQSLSNEDNVRGPSSLTEYIMDRKDSTKSLSKVDIIGAPSSIQEKTTDGKNSIESLSKNDTDEGPSSPKEKIMDIRDSTQSLSKKDIIGGSSSLKEKTMNGRVSTQSLAKEDIIGEKRSYKNGWCSCLLGGLPYYKENTMDERDSTQSLSEEDTVGDKKGSLQFIQPVEKLREAGIKFKKREEEEGIDSFLDIKFRDGILEIPCLTTSEIMSPLILNCIAFEQSFKDSTKHFTSYFNFISYLINTPLDAAYLRKKKIIENFFGTDQELVNFFNEVGKNIPYYFQEDYLMEVCNQVEIYYRNIWHVRCAEFWYKYCGSLWIVMSALAAVFLILLSMLQGGLALYKVIKGSP